MRPLYFDKAELAKAIHEAENHLLQAGPWDAGCSSFDPAFVAPCLAA
jgi:hypothetical protein